MRCPACAGELQSRFRFCPWCARPLRLKLVEFFRPHASIDADRAKALRVSRYIGPEPQDRHVRFSVWDESTPRPQATAAVSLDEGEARRLAEFVLSAEPQAPRTLRAALASMRDVYVVRR